MTRALAAFLVLIVSHSAASAQQIVRRLWYETAIDSTAINFNWSTTEPTGTQFVLYRDTTILANVHFKNFTREHWLTIDELSPATIYRALLIARDTAEFYTSTSSLRPGRSDAYFNRSADFTFVPPLTAANGNTSYLQLLKDQIDSAKESVDLAVYSFSGSVGNAIGTRLIAAKARGVKVRVIADSASSNDSQPFQRLATNGIPTILSSFGANGDVRSNIHHNKFVLIDARQQSDKATILTGSWNLSDVQTFSDFQNILVTRDLSLARCYLAEFEEEWGGAGDLPEAAHSKFSTHKTENTPRSFNLDGSEAHVFFSPNGNATAALDSVLGMAKHQILFATLSFTRDDIAATMIRKLKEGVQVHGIINNKDQGGEFQNLKDAGVDVLYYPPSDSVLLHHKYAIVDPGTDSGWVITGSQNWSTNGEARNNENMILIRDRSLTEAYFQEWLARYHEAGGAQEIAIPLKNVVLPSYAHATFSSRFAVEWEQTSAGPVSIEVFDLVGNTVKRVTEHRDQGIAQLTLQSLTPGVYMVVLQHDRTRETRKILLY